MEIITLVVKQMSIDVVDGRVKNARHWYSAPNLEIHVFGQVPIKKYDLIHHQAMSECLARHIPLISLKKHGRV